MTSLEGCPEVDLGGLCRTVEDTKEQVRGAFLRPLVTALDRLVPLVVARLWHGPRPLDRLALTG